jgi:glycosyltransferase involved in cell wall biosynthesis
VSAPQPISVIIPAHNEARVIGRCLQRLLRDARPDELEVIVACNGCSDDTAAVAAAAAPGVRVASTAVASKIAALNLGDELATGFPRLYLDADVELDTAAVREIAAVLQRGDALAASPMLDLDVSRSSPAVRSYLRIWSQLPSVRGDLVGRGAYALSEAGRRRFATFPEVAADDHFIRSTFAPHERTSVDHARSVVQAPRTLRALIRRKVRVFEGNRRLEAAHGGDRERGGGWLAVVRADRRRLVDAPVYVLVSLAAKGLAAWRTLRGKDGAWLRDDSSR